MYNVFRKGMKISMCNKRKFYSVIFIAVVLLLIPVFMYGKYYVNGQTLGDADFVQYFSGKKYLGKCILEGEFPQWNKYLSAGMPQAAVSDFYLISTLFSFLPLKEFMYVYFIFHLFLGSFFFYLYLKECGCSLFPAFVMAIIFECSIQINGLRKGHPTIIAAICLFPLIMFCVKKFFRTSNSRWLYLSAVSAGLQFTIGIQYGIYADIFLLIYLLIVGIYNKFSIWDILKKGILWLVLYFGSVSYMLLPSLSIMKEYAFFGSSNTSFETFCSWSIHPIKLLQMVFPKIFGEIYQAFGYMYSSEMDIELYLGILILFLALCMCKTNFNRIDVKADIICAVFAFLYAMVAHIPYVNQFVFHLPVLGGFRCPARILFIFYFFMLSLSGKELDKIYNKIEEKDIDFIKKMAQMLFIFTFLLMVSAILVVSILSDPADKLEDCYLIKEIVWIPFIISITVIYLLSVLRKRKSRSQIKCAKYMICCVVLIITLIETQPYSSEISNLDMQKLDSYDEAEKKISGCIENYKIWDAYEGIDGAHDSIISQNKSVSKKIPSINAYTAFNNPLICKYFKNLGAHIDDVPFNFSGLMTGSLNAFHNLVFQNDLLSMLGVRYVIDSSGVIENQNGEIFDTFEETEVITLQENIKISTAEGIVGVHQIMAGIKPNTVYKIKFYLTDKEKISFLSIDLYGGENYDSAAQEERIDISENVDEYTVCLYSGETDHALEEIVMRFLVCAESESIEIDKCEVSEIEPQKAYSFFASDENGTKIYMNQNAKPILYFPKRVERTNDFSDFYKHSILYDLDDVAYVYRNSFELKDSQKNIAIKSYTNNVLEAVVTVEEDSYLCFSQLYSKNWKVSVDGVRQDVDMVNGLIMGIPVTAGNHVVVFNYNDRAYMAGFVITIIITIVTFAWFLLLMKRQEKRLQHDR